MQYLNTAVARDSRRASASGTSGIFLRAPASSSVARSVLVWDNIRSHLTAPLRGVGALAAARLDQPDLLEAFQHHAQQPVG
ncbi:hypothetical protein ACFQZP_30410 [Streptomyces lutosisoli]|uniref:Uncharacterized protein n=1 Tax=Streptomyces lutosisoli TaxID=2665721 RepID=A0ABW2VS41_9ACTN